MLWNLLSWYFILVALGWLTFPLTYRVLGKLADRGYALSRTLGLLLWGYVFWLLSFLSVLQNQPGGILFALVILISISVWAGWQARHEMASWIRRNWRLILVVELVFLVCFTFMVLVRASDPDATGTEKPMELAFINAILKSESFPPNDPWLSGYAISYYHFGYILAAMLAKLISTSGGVAFNLMLAVVFGLGGVGAFGVLYNLLGSRKQTENKRNQNAAWALMGPLFLLFVSNLEGVLEVLHQAGVGWKGNDSSSRLWNWINIESLRRPPSQPFSWVPQRFWWWWQASRVVQDIDLLDNVSGLSPIDEFPAFSFVLGDLHPHVLVIPFAMLLIGLALHIYLGGMNQESRIPGFHIPFKVDLLLLSALVLGGIIFLNTWDFPVYFALLFGAYVLNRIQTEGLNWDRIYDGLKFGIPLGILSLGLVAPFLVSLQSQAGGILPNILYPTRGLYLWIMFGSLFVPILLYFGWLRRRNTPSNWRVGVGFVVALIVLLALVSVGMGLIAARTEIGVQIIASQGETTPMGLLSSALKHRVRFGFGLLTLAAILSIGLSLLVGFVQLEKNENEHRDSHGFVLLMILLGGIMVLAPEFVYLRDVFGARMNTVFKFYYQAWMLWSISASFVAVLILRSGRVVSKVIVVIVLGLSLVYPLLAFPAKTNGFYAEQGYRLDAGGYLAIQQPQEAAAIKWLEQQPSGAVAEAVGGQYSGFARVATLSGQPAVLGWPGHEGQWRGSYEEVGSREEDIRLLYETFDWQSALTIIQRYNVRYIFVGSLEMSTYAVNEEKFTQNLRAVFSEGDVRVYLVPALLSTP